MHDNSILYNGKTQAGASHLAATTFIHTIETLENAHEMLLRNTYAIVGETEMPIVAGLTGGQRDGGAIAGIGNGIVGEIAEDAVEQRSIASHDEWRWQLIDKCHAAPGQLEGCFLLNVTDGFVDVNGFELVGDGSGIESVKR